MIVDDPARALPTVERLAELGAVLAVDDFGTGYSSLEYLKRLPVSEIKIDRGFVMTLADDPRDEAIARSTVQLGRSLGLRVVAEGVESAVAARRLADIGCDQAQGYHFSPPLPLEEFTPWVRARVSAPRPDMEPTRLVRAPLLVS